MCGTQTSPSSISSGLTTFLISIIVKRPRQQLKGRCTYSTEISYVNATDYSTVLVAMRTYKW